MRIDFVEKPKEIGYASKRYDILPNLSKLIFERYGRKEYAHIQGMITADTMVCSKSE